MTPNAIDGLVMILAVTVTTCLLCPVLTWILPDRTKTREV